MMTSQEKEPPSNFEESRAPAASLLPITKPETPVSPPLKDRIPSAFYVIVWIALSSSVIIFNKWILDPNTTNFRFPIFLTTWHLLFSCIATQVLARASTLLDGRKTVKMTGKVYLRAICPIGLFFSLSLICSNKAYLFLSVSFIQMLKATTPVAVLIAAWSLRIESPNLGILKKVTFIVLGVMIASYGEILFNSTGFLFQVFGIAFEAIRLVMVQRLLSSAEYKMDPLVSLYYFAPVCAVMNFFLFLVIESSTMGVSDLLRVGWPIFLMNAMVAFALNVSVVMLIGKTSSLVLTLCGVLKDILLVCASMIIWGNPVTILQLFGYSIALSGLMYYKLGADKIREHCMTRSLGSRRVAFGALAVFIIIGLGSMYNGPSSYNPARFIPSNGLSKEKLDIVLSLHQEDTRAVRNQVADLLSLPGISAMKPRIRVYTMDPKADVQELAKEIGAHDVEKIPNKGRESDTYLTHILSNWGDLADHTLFLHGEVKELANVKIRIQDFFIPSTGMLSLGSDHATCSCNRCRDPWSKKDIWVRVPEIFSTVHGELCPGTQLLVSHGSQFIVSAKRIRSTDKHVYQHFKEVLESDSKHWIHEDSLNHGVEDILQNPFFGRALEKSWMILFRCSESRLAESCPKFDVRRKEGDRDDACQCLDRN